jgi:quinol-cytochrome oxidoreductase complex cytochrome b subunit
MVSDRDQSLRFGICLSWSQPSYWRANAVISYFSR